MKNIPSLILKQLIWSVIRLLVSTYRIEFKNSELRPKGSFVFAVWHEQVVGALTAHAWTENYLTLASRSKDGDYAAYVARKMGYVTIRGSSRKKNVDKGGKEAILEYIAGLQNGK